VGAVLHAWAAQRRSAMLAGHRVPEHVHMGLRLPPQDSVAEVGGSRTGQSAMAVARPLGGRQRHVHGATCWASGDAVSTVGCAAEPMRRDLRHQEQLEAQGREEDGAC
jgi:REP element-mobilizing transposase RayT